MDELRKETDELNRIAREVFRASGISFGGTSDKRRTFPDGFKWRYTTHISKIGYQRWWFCWSIKKNANGKFVSWIYKWQKKSNSADFTNIREHKKKYKAKDRAHRMKDQREKEIEKCKTS